MFLAQVAKLCSVNWLHLTRTAPKSKSTQMTNSYYFAEKTTESPLEETSTFPPQTKLKTSPVPLYGNETTGLTSQSTSDVSVSKQMLTSTGKTKILSFQIKFIGVNESPFLSSQLSQLRESVQNLFQLRNSYKRYRNGKMLPLSNLIF